MLNQKRLLRKLEKRLNKTKSPLITRQITVIRMTHSLHMSRSFELHKHDSKKTFKLCSKLLATTKTKTLPDSPHSTLVNTFSNFFNNKPNILLNTLPPGSISYSANINEKHSPIMIDQFTLPRLDELTKLIQSSHSACPLDSGQEDITTISSA